MSKWSTIYEDQLQRFPSLEHFIEHKVGYKLKLIEVVQSLSGKNRPILEVGCGTGVTCLYLEAKGYQASGIDADPDMIRLANSIAKKRSSAATFVVDDLKTLDTVHDRQAVIFSNGVMEHFSDDDIVTIVNRHLSISDCVVISVPSNYFSDNQRIHGDERFMSVSAWREILSAATGSIKEEFSFESDKPLGQIPQFIGFVLSSP